MKIFFLNFLLAIFSLLSASGQSRETRKIDLARAAVIIDSLDRQFENHFHNGDSLALFNMYAKDGSFGTVKGNDILGSWGKQIRAAIKNDTRQIKYTTTLLTTDNEFLFEAGTYQMIDSKDNIKYKGKYLVVWKHEEGTWKLFKDIGL
ncbi:MAG: nuclear transport factor 2 family protein [Ferruginibacter sp.]